MRRALDCALDAIGPLLWFGVLGGAWTYALIRIEAPMWWVIATVVVGTWIAGYILRCAWTGHWPDSTGL